MNRILVTGANGQLGSEIRGFVSLSNKLKDEFFFTDSSELDIIDKEHIFNYVKQKNINAIINCAAYTAVDKAEDEVEIAEKVNAIGPKNLAEAAKKFNCSFVHISTDYVYDGTNHKPYQETDTPNPISVYGKTKLQGESNILKINPKNTVIIRTSWVYSKYGNNFVKTMLKLGSSKNQLNVIDDQIGTPTHAKDLAKAILEILPQIDNVKVEVFHYTNLGVCSWFDFAKTIFDKVTISCNVLPVPSKEYVTKAKRPYYSVLNKNKIMKNYNIKIPYWKDTLYEFLKDKDLKDVNNRLIKS